MKKIRAPGLYHAHLKDVKLRALERGRTYSRIPGQVGVRSGQTGRSVRYSLGVAKANDVPKDPTIT